MAFDCALEWVAELIGEGSAHELRDVDTSATISVSVDPARGAFDTRGWCRLTRGAWHRDGEVVLENACTSGFDLHVACNPAGAEFTYRWRPPVRDRAAAWVLRSRFHLLARAVLMQYPALWWAGIRGRAPLHASAWTNGASTPLVTAASGIGRSTVLLHELESGARATGDNVAVGDGTTVWGLVEPVRAESGGGRRMPHGRHESAIADRVEALVPDALVLLERGSRDEALLRRCGSERAERALVTSTYMAGELRRYWSFAATLAAGTGLGPAHPPISEVASAFADAQPCFVLVLGKSPGAQLSELLTALDVAECA
ncbi:MAG: hypothetical protein WAQ33_01580 [Gaiellaceae bacterium]